MSRMESIEYYSACPQCGAANVGMDKCDYCGASLIKSRVNTDFQYSKNSEEEKNFEEDSYYPEIKGKIYTNDTFLLLFCSIFGGAFILVPAIIMIAFISAGIMEIWVVAMLLLFFAIGIGSLIPLINYYVKKSKCKQGEDISGIVRGYEETMVSVNGRPVLAVRLLIDEMTNPKILILNTGETKRKYPLGRVITLRGYDNNFIIVENRNL